jgi:hypothetical protein
LYPSIRPASFFVLTYCIIYAEVYRCGLTATVLEDDIEHTALESGPDLLLATLVLEHIDWHRGVEVLAGLRPATCGIIIQENPPGMSSAVTPGRAIPLSIAKAVEIAHPTIVPHDELLAAFEGRGYRCKISCAQEVADGKRLIAVLFLRHAPGREVCSQCAPG